MKWQVIILFFLILASVAAVSFFSSLDRASETAGVSTGAPVKTALPSWESAVSKVPTRDWNVLDPGVSSQAVILESLDDNFPFFKYNSYKMWPLASLTKLLTAVVVVENVGLDEKIEISPEVMKTQGEAGDLRAGEVYSSGDLLKIMLMMSSNRAAAAFEYSAGHDQFVKTMMDKARSMNMTQTVVFDASGLNDENKGTATDVLNLLSYILEHEPEILNYTRLSSVIVQPLNSDRSHTITNIDPLVTRPDFLGGKTGTSAAAGQNLAAILSFQNRRVAAVILGSTDRFGEIDNLFVWVKEAYGF